MNDSTKVKALLNNTDALLKEWDHAGVTVSVVKDGKTVFAGAFGMRDVAQGIPADADTLYQIGSCSKAFTTTAAAICVDRGLLEWDKPVREYLPWLRFSDEYTTVNITLRDLISHRSGLPRHDVCWIVGSYTRRQVVENLKVLPANYPMRTKWQYSNLCFVLIGVLVETVTHMTWEEFVRKNIFKPLAMKRSGFFTEDLKADANHALPYKRPKAGDTSGIKQCDYIHIPNENRATGEGANMGPAGSIYSSANEMAHWITMNLNKGEYRGKRIVSEENLKVLHSSIMLMDGPLLMPMDEMDFYTYGGGWFVECYRGHRLVEHGGNINGFSSFVALIPDQNLGIFTNVNFDSSFLPNAVAGEIMDMYLGAKSEKPWSARYKEFIEKVVAEHIKGYQEMKGPKTEGTRPTHALQDYTGTYRCPGYPDMVVTVEDEAALTLRLKANLVETVMGHYHYDCFEVTDFEFIAGPCLAEFVMAGPKVSALKYRMTYEPNTNPMVFEKVVEKEPAGEKAAETAKA
jgi:CubicO group peptidase (beta-lactamase class C family)